MIYIDLDIYIYITYIYMIYIDLDIYIYITYIYDKDYGALFGYYIYVYIYICIYIYT